MKNYLLDPIEDMKKFRQEMDKLVDSFWSKRALPESMLGLREPLMDIEDKKNELEITTELPGIGKEDICITVEEDRVEIKAEKKKEKETHKKNFYRQERAYTSYYKAVSLPAKVDANKAKCSYENGVLKISLPKVKQVEKKGKTLYLR